MCARIIDINEKNINEYGLLCKKSQKKEVGYQNKVNWIKERFKEGLRYKLLLVKEGKKNIFSKGLDRASFGEYTVVLKSIPPFLVCYIFKGQSYQAQRRIGYFVNSIQKENDIWQVFQEFYQVKREVQLNDIPTLEPILTDIFINKKIPMEELEMKV